MKKLQLCTLLMLLSTGYIAQASGQDDQDESGPSQMQSSMGPNGMASGQGGSMRGNGQQGKKHKRQQGGQQQGGGMMNPQMKTQMQAQVTAAFGGSVTVDSFNSYTQANDISLTSPVTLAQVQDIQKIIMNIQMGLMQLAQAAGVQPAAGQMQKGGQSGATQQNQGKGKGKGKGKNQRMNQGGQGGQGNQGGLNKGQGGSISGGPIIGGQYQGSASNNGAAA